MFMKRKMIGKDWVVINSCLIICHVATVALRQETFGNRRVRHQDVHDFCRYALMSSQGKEPCIDPWTNAIIDYSGANEYMESHYGNHPLLKSAIWATSSAPYFFRNISEGDKVLEPIYNARELQFLDENTNLLATNKSTVLNSTKNTFSRHREILKKYGMTLVDSPTTVVEWSNKKIIEDVYIKELENLLSTLFPSEIEMYCFWNPMLRGELHELSPPQQQRHSDTQARQKRDDIPEDKELPIPTANVASAVHIDTDVGAYDSLESFLKIVRANEVKRQGDAEPFNGNKYQNAISNEKKRFAVINFWRSTNRETAVTTSPLAILSTRYEDEGRRRINTNSSSSRTTKTKNFSDFSAFPVSRPDLDQSKWYSFPNMTNNEVLVFYQYDRLGTQPSDLWHCAISVEIECAEGSGVNSNPGLKRRKAPRESFDIRALIVFDEVVNSDEDRFHPERIRPLLSFEESGCFCDEQAISRDYS